MQDSAAAILPALGKTQKKKTGKGREMPRGTTLPPVLLTEKEVACVLASADTRPN